MGCRTCQWDLDDADRFCPGCGEPLDSATPTASIPLRGEQRWVTALYCSIVGAAQPPAADAEAATDLLDDFREVARGLVDQHGGEVTNLLGEAVLAVFGWPLAHGDDPERAVHCALRLRTAFAEPDWGPSCSEPVDVRIGVHSGPVIASAAAAGDHRHQVLGETMNVAARLEGAAAAGDVLVSASTLDLVPGIFVSEPRGQVVLRGVAQPMEVVAVVRRTGVGRLDPTERLTPLVGRTHEIRMLTESVDAAGSGEGSSLALVGDAGVGKSRIVRAFRSQLGSNPHSWLEARCRPGDDRAFGPVIDLVRNALADDTTPASIIRALRLPGLEPEIDGAVLSRLLSTDGTSSPAPRLAAGDQTTAVLDVLVRWVEALADVQPAVIVLEDLHWADTASLDLHAALTDLAGRAPIVVVATMRTDPLVAVARLVEDSRIRRVDIAPLRGPSARALVESMPASSLLSEAVIEAIVARAGGSPLHLEELTKATAEARVDPSADITAVPATLRGLLDARLDRLGPARRLAQAAAVVGREFELDLVSAILHVPHEAARPDADLLIERGLWFNVDESEGRFAFHHALFRDAAYESLLSADRRLLHSRVAEQLREPGRADPAVVADHEARGETPEQAGPLYVEAVARAQDRGMFDEVTAVAARALDGAGPHEAAVEVALLNYLITSRWHRFGWADADLWPRVEQLVATASEHGEPTRLAEALCHRSNIGVSVGHPDRVQFVETMAAAASQLGSGGRTMRLWASTIQAFHQVVESQFVEALATIDGTSVDIDDDPSWPHWELWRSTDFSLAAWGLGAMSSSALGRVDRMERFIERIERADGKEDANGMTTTCVLVSLAYLVHHRFDEAEHWVKFARTVRDISVQATSGLMVDAIAGCIRLCAGDLDARDETDRAIEALATTGQMGGGSIFVSLEAHSLARLGVVDDAAAIAELALGVADSAGTAGLELSEAVLAAAAAHRGDEASADDWASRARRRVERSGATAFLPWIDELCNGRELSAVGRRD